MKHPKEIWEMIYSCIAVHNFIRITDSSVDYDLELALEFDAEEEDENNNGGEENFEDSASAKLWRDEIAIAMWNDFISYLETI